MPDGTCKELHLRSAHVIIYRTYNDCGSYSIFHEFKAKFQVSSIL